MLSGGGGVQQSSLASLPSINNNNNNNTTTTTGPLKAARPNGSSQVAGRVVRTLYACVGENESELSFEPNIYLTNGERRGLAMVMCLLFLVLLVPLLVIIHSIML